jgi:hypothetical protein
VDRPGFQVPAVEEQIAVLGLEKRVVAGERLNQHLTQVNE